MRPEHGGRLELKLADGSPTQARYVVSIFTPLGDSTSEASLDAASGSLEIAEWQGMQPPAWLDTLARSLLRTVFRTKTSDGDWPRRITRWRPEPRS